MYAVETGYVTARSGTSFCGVFCVLAQVMRATSTAAAAPHACLGETGNEDRSSAMRPDPSRLYILGSSARCRLMRR